jgi:uncharacterized protein (TIGR03435 family)
MSTQWRGPMACAIRASMKESRTAMTYRTARIAFGILLLQAPRVYAQTPAPRPQFEVASIKLDSSCGNRAGRGLGQNPFSTGRLNMECVTLQRLIQLAYGAFADGVSPNMQMLQISGGPGWTQSEFYNLTAKAEGAARVEQMMGPMLQTLLEDRFKLKIHRETKEIPVYALTLAKSGIKAHPLKEGDCVAIDPNHLPAPTPGQPMPNFCGNTSMRMNGQSVTMDGHGMSLRDFSARLSTMLDRNVIDKSGVTGLFDFHLEFAPDEATPSFRGGRGGAGDPGNPASAAEIAGPSIFDALQEQLGLKLLPDNGPVESLVIDHVEKPSEN